MREMAGKKWLIGGRSRVSRILRQVISSRASRWKPSGLKGEPMVWGSSLVEEVQMEHNQLGVLVWGSSLVEEVQMEHNQLVVLQVATRQQGVPGVGGPEDHY